MRLFLWSHQPFIEIKIWSRDDGSPPARARAAAIFGSCASDHFLNPLVPLFIEVPMMASFSEFKNLYGDDFNS
jgi:hypothetical protein